MDILLIVLQSLLALVFLMAGLTKVAGNKMHVDHFTKWGLPQWFRIVTGVIEIISAAALVVGFWDSSWTAVGALVIAITAIGGFIIHVRSKDSFKETFPILFLAIIAFIVFFLCSSELANFPGFN